MHSKIPLREWNPPSPFFGQPDMQHPSLTQTVFWLSALALGYTYVGYPLLVWTLGKLRNRAVRRMPVEPTVTVLITAYNEEAAIGAKLENTLEIDYPCSLLEIIVASDGSTDRTEEIAASFADRGVRLVRQSGRLGKTATQNAAVGHASGEIIVFSDATTEYPKDLLRRLLPAFADDSVGCVAGRLVYTDRSGSGVGDGALSYWDYETFIKQAESDACSLIGASGCLYAVRKSAYRPMYPEACSDFLICTILYSQGLRSVYEPAAACIEETNRESGKEFDMRVRIIAQTFTDLWRNRGMMNPFRSGFYAVQLFSHKVMRYGVPLFLTSALLSALAGAGESTILKVALMGQIALYLAALVAAMLHKAGLRTGLFGLPFYFVLSNAAAAAGFYKFVRGERYASWEPFRAERGDDGRPVKGLETT